MSDATTVLHNHTQALANNDHMYTHTAPSTREKRRGENEKNVQTRRQKHSHNSNFPLQLQMQPPNQRNRNQQDDGVDDKIRHGLCIRQHLRVDALRAQRCARRRPPDVDVRAAGEDSGERHAGAVDEDQGEHQGDA